MKRPQFSLWWLLGLTTFAAIGCLALANASGTWAMSLHSAMLGLLLVAILSAAFRDGPVRAFWVGFAVWGWIYLAMAFGSLRSSLSDGPFSPGDCCS